LQDRPADRIARRALVAGHVQGVGFRWHTGAEARALGVLGHVLNLPDGRVEVWAEGRPSAVEALLAWLAKGPSGARVEGLEVEDVPPVGARAFEVRR